MRVHPRPHSFPIKVGQKVILYPTKNYNRNEEFKFRRGTITKIGRKYFTVRVLDSLALDNQFTLSEFVSKDIRDMNAGYYVFEDEDALRKEFTRQWKWAIVNEAITRYNASNFSDEEIESIFSAIPEGSRNHSKERADIQNWSGDAAG